MQQTSDLYKQLLAGYHWTETRLSIGSGGRLIDSRGRRITFGGLGIKLGDSDAGRGFGGGMVQTLGTELKVFSEDRPTVGSCVAGEITVRMLKPAGTIPRQAKLVPYVRLTDGTRRSEWLQKGVYYVDTRKEDASGGLRWITLTGFDAMLLAEVDYPLGAAGESDLDIDVVTRIAAIMGVEVDDRTTAAVTRGYRFPYRSGYSCREVLGAIAAAYGGCFVMSDTGQLRLIQLRGDTIA